MRKGRKLIGFLAVCFLAVTLLLPVNAAAEASAAVNEARKGVLQVNLVYIDQKKNENVIQGGSGFLIGAETGAEYMITNYHVIAMDNEMVTAATEFFGVDFSNPNNVNMQVQVVVKRDVVIKATVVNSSETMDFAILKLEQPIYDRESLAINKNDDQAVETMDVYALGFPEAIRFFEDPRVYTSDDVNITNGIVSKKATRDGIKYICHSATLSDGNSGGPLVNSSGQVMGVNTSGVVDTYFYSLQISEVTAVLDALGIPYSEEGSQVPVPDSEPESEAEAGPGLEPQPQPEVEKSGLSAALEMANAMVLDGYTEESVQRLQDAVSSGQSVLNDSGASQMEVDTAADAINTARTGLAEKESGFPSWAIIAVVIGVVALVVIVVLIVVLSGRKKDQRGSNTHPVSGGGMPPENPASFGGWASGEGSENTVLRGDGSDATSILGGGMSPISATLIRRKSGENFQITKQTFTIGKERVKVDCCIPDNTSISRTHAQILFKNGSFYIVDLKSLNFTYVNGNKIAPGQEMKLNSGDRIKLSDEEFEFRC